MVQLMQQMISLQQENIDLRRGVGAESLNTSTEQELLQHIKSVAVKGLHKEIHRHTFHGMYQSEGESITHYLARLKAQAKFCDFLVTCSSTTCVKESVMPTI